MDTSMHGKKNKYVNKIIFNYNKKHNVILSLIFLFFRVSLHVPFYTSPECFFLIIRPRARFFRCKKRKIVMNISRK